jgi:hypothetical protein
LKNKKNLSEDEGLFGVAFADILISVLGVIFAIFILSSLLPRVEVKPIDNTHRQGIICAELSWDDSRDVDLDLWGKSPLDSVPVGYSNMHGPNLDLFKDVYGFRLNPAKHNLEIMCGQVLAAGEWTFNVHYYGIYDGDKKPIPLDAIMVIHINPPFERGTILTKKITLNATGEEETMFDFRLDDNGHLVDSSVNSLFKPLRSTPSSSPIDIQH